MEFVLDFEIGIWDFMIILGIDPGTHTTGFGLIENQKNSVRHLENGLIIGSEKNPLPLRLKKIYEIICKLIEQFKPEAIALEDIFMSKNARSSLKLGTARGVVMLACAQKALPVFEYPPALIKKAISGNGQASKEQMQKMVQIHLKLKEAAAEDAADALAVALCHSQMRQWK